MASQAGTAASSSFSFTFLFGEVMLMLYLTPEEILPREKKEIHRMGAMPACSWFPVQSQENGQMFWKWHSRCYAHEFCLHHDILDQAIARNR